MFFGLNTLTDARKFQKLLQQVLNSVLLVQVESPSKQLCTGWLITDRLLVIPDYVGTENDSFTCFLNTEDLGLSDPVKARLVYRSSAAGKGLTPSLLELAHPLPFVQLPLEAENPIIDDPVFIVQYANGLGNPSISVGHVRSYDPPWLYHDASTEPGSGGSPIISFSRGTVIGMHVRSDVTSQKNSGPPVASLLDGFKSSPYWDTIRRYHKLADINAIIPESIPAPVTTQWNEVLVKAALTWNFNPDELSETEKKEIEPYVVDKSSPRWAVKPHDRVAILQSVPADEVKNYLPSDGAIARASGSATTGQRVINRIFERADYDLQQVPEEELPYWLQAVRWFGPLKKDLPSPADVNRVLERRRIRSELRIVGGDDFKGRVQELERLKNWHRSDDGPIQITGIGGIGKSALISHFALSLPDQAVLLWLDFDSPQIAPDDAVSILKVLAEQLATQVEGFVFKTDLTDPASKTWEPIAEELAADLSRATTNAAPLLVMDGFEVAQHVKRYQEVWSLLETVLGKCPNLRIAISGRSALGQLSLRGKANPEPVVLKGMDESDAKALLAAAKITQPAIVDKIIEISKGIPLVLKLAVHYVDKGGKMEELLEKLPQELVEGYLYQRILERVMDNNLKPLVEKVLVLRKITVPILSIFKDDLPQGYGEDETFEALSREMALVSDPASNEGIAVTSIGGESLQLRPELRAATIKLLEIKDAKTVKEVDEKAVRFYQGADLEKNENRAELLYHLLRLDEWREANQYWHPACAPLLKYAADDLPDTAAESRRWLKDQLSAVMTGVKDDYRIWEQDALIQIHEQSARGHGRGISGTLQLRDERSAESPLLVFDALELWNSGDALGALHLLTNNAANSPLIVRNQRVLQALIERSQGKFPKADATLQAIGSEPWNDRANGALEQLALQAARIRLAVRLDIERAFLKDLVSNAGFHADALKEFFYSRYFVVPYLTELVSDAWGLESAGSHFSLPATERELAQFADVLDRRSRPLPGFLQFSLDHPNLEALFNANGIAGDVPAEVSAVDAQRAFAASGAYRWKAASSSFLLRQFVQVADGKYEVMDPLALGVVFTLAAFRGFEMSVITRGFSERSIDGFLVRVAKNVSYSVVPPVNSLQKEMLLDLLYTESGVYSKSVFRETPSRPFTSGYVPSEGAEGSLKSIFAIGDEKRISVGLYLAGPDPLEMLCRRLLGLPDAYKFYA